jgi:predicted phage terminase large subunit-like protein
MEKKAMGKFHIWERPAHNPKTGVLNFPRLLSEKKLAELRTVKQGKDGVDAATFMAQYELDPLSPAEQIFKTLHYVDINSVKFDMFVMWTDPALSDKGTACYAPVVVLARIAGAGKWMAAYASVERRTPEKTIAAHNRIYRMTRDMYKIQGDAFMEDNGFQLLMKNDAVLASAKDGDEVCTIGRKNTENKLARIRSMEPYVSQGFIVFRKDWETAPENYRLLIEQLVNFPQGMVDAPDALQGAHKQTQSRFMS